MHARNSRPHRDATTLKNKETRRRIDSARKSLSLPNGSVSAITLLILFNPFLYHSDSIQHTHTQQPYPDMNSAFHCRATPVEQNLVSSPNSTSQATHDMQLFDSMSHGRFCGRISDGTDQALSILKALAAAPSSRRRASQLAVWPIKPSWTRRPLLSLQGKRC